ncbi:MAG: S41 family peptidase [Armatimonadota bacterium]
MQRIHKIGVCVLLVVLCFGLGMSLRVKSDRAQSALALKAETPFEGTQIASSRLDLTVADIRPLKTLYSVLRSLREHYVDPITVKDEGKMSYGAIRWMLASLNDPETRFIEPDHRKLLGEAREGKFYGIGAVTAIRQTIRPNTDKDKTKDTVSEEHLIVATVLPGGPADRAGLKPGDEIVAINGKDVLPFDPYQHFSDTIKQENVRNMERPQLLKMIDTEQKRIDDGIAIIDAEKMLMSDDKKPVELSLAAQPPLKSKTITIQPSEITVKPLDDAIVMAGNIGYIRVRFFGDKTASEFSAAMKKLQNEKLAGLIVDLRGSTGWDILAADNIASWFAPRKVMAFRIRSRGRKDVIRIPTAESAPWTRPVVLLVDGSTTKAPEILAAALKDNGIAKLVGEKTFGNFVDSTMIDLADGSAIVMSTGKYVTGKGNDYNLKGVPVDVPVNASDAQMKEAIKLLSESEGGN